MKLEALTPMLRTWDMRASISFYTELLGFECESFDEDLGWASLQRDGVAVMLSGPNQHEGDQAPAFTGSAPPGIWARRCANRVAAAARTSSWSTSPASLPAPPESRAG